MYSIFVSQELEMEPTDVSGTYIKIETLRDKNPTEIHGALSTDCGEFTVDYSSFLLG